MNEVVAYVVPATLTLLGSALGIYVGYRRWKNEQERQRQAAFLAERKAAHQELWTRIEEIHFQVRTKELGKEELRHSLQDMNRFILTNEVYLDTDMHQLANEYVHALHNLARAIRE